MAFLNKAVLAVMAVIAVAIAPAAFTVAQNIPACASKLVPCATFISSKTKPDNTCCSSIKEAVTNDLPCLCTLYTTPGLLQTFNVSVADALRVTRDCNVPADISSCSKAASPTSTAVAPPPGKHEKNDASGGRAAWAGITGLLLFWAAAMVLY